MWLCTDIQYSICASYRTHRLHFIEDQKRRSNIECGHRTSNVDIEHRMCFIEHRKRKSNIECGHRISNTFYRISNADIEHRMRFIEYRMRKSNIEYVLSNIECGHRISNAFYRIVHNYIINVNYETKGLPYKYTKATLSVEFGDHSGSGGGSMMLKPSGYSKSPRLHTSGSVLYNNLGRSPKLPQLNLTWEL